jgi:putative peptidoglycan lipid II flippase
MVMMLLNLGLDLLLSKWIGYAGIAMATSAVSLVWIITLATLFRHVTGYPLGMGQSLFTLKIASASAFMGVSVTLLSLVGTGFGFMHLAYSIIIGTLVYASILRLLGISEFNNILVWISKRSKLYLKFKASNP